MVDSEYSARDRSNYERLSSNEKEIMEGRLEERGRRDRDGETSKVEVRCNSLFF